MRFHDSERFAQWVIDLICGVEEVETRPYIDERLSDRTWIRTFDPNVTDSDEYVWHRDERGRIVTVLEGENWQFQFDDEIPFHINRSDVIKIPKQVYHRILVGNTPLKLKIEEVE
jgi:hypothetical protein